MTKECSDFDKTFWQMITLLRRTIIEKKVLLALHIQKHRDLIYKALMLTSQRCAQCLQFVYSTLTRSTHTVTNLEEVEQQMQIL